MDADEIIARYGLTPHPEGGHYREIFRADAEEGGRGAVTSIYYLLRAGEVSAWHRVDAGRSALPRVTRSGRALVDGETDHRLGVARPWPQVVFPSAPGRARGRRAPGLWSAARSRRPSSSPASSSPRPVGSRGARSARAVTPG